MPAMQGKMENFSHRRLTLSCFVFLLQGSQSDDSKRPFFFVFPFEVPYIFHLAPFYFHGPQILVPSVSSVFLDVLLVPISDIIYFLHGYRTEDFPLPLSLPCTLVHFPCGECQNEVESKVPEVVHLQTQNRRSHSSSHRFSETSSSLVPPIGRKRPAIKKNFVHVKEKFLDDGNTLLLIFLFVSFVTAEKSIEVFGAFQQTAMLRNGKYTLLDFKNLIDHEIAERFTARRSIHIRA
mmetsp:Transcript_10456/g.23909  ORF Transcript_10456/g.23909 Transcript_10456/m.23909 type:complete len:236 (-) Transcript_10456:652-1359(-)